MLSGYSGKSGYTAVSGYADKGIPTYGKSGVSGTSNPLDIKPAVVKKGYYEEKEEAAVIRFLESTDPEEKRRIYNDDLKKPIDKMIESIIRRYRLYRADFEFVNLHADALSFLITKFDKFDPSKGKKSFSYFGTICRNYLYGEMIKSYKRSIRTIDYECTVNELMKRPDMITHIDQEDVNITHFINKLIGEIEEELKSKKIGENEYKVGISIVQIFKDWAILFEDFVGTPKFNKNLILLWLREMTGLNTKEIRNAMRRYKSLYYIYKDNYIT